MCKKLAGGVPIKKFGIRILEDLSYVPNTHGCIGERHLHLSSTCSMFWVCSQILYEFFFFFTFYGSTIQPNTWSYVFGRV